MAESQVLEQDPAQGRNEAVAVGVGHFDRTVCGVSRLAVLIDALGEWVGGLVLGGQVLFTIYFMEFGFIYCIL